jgi:putative ABC transport system substrate-binding protein
MHRRTLVAGLGGLALLNGRRLAAQPAGRPIVAVLSPLSAELAEAPESVMTVVIRRLAELGDANGTTIDIQSRFADGDFQRLPKLAAQLVALAPAVIYTWTTPGGRAAAGATPSIPIVIGPVGALSMHALVADFAHPPGNITGMPGAGPAEHGKCLGLLKDAVPGVSRVGVLTNPKNPLWKTYPGVLAEFARPLGIELVGAPIGGPADIEPAFADMESKGVNGLFIGADTAITSGAAKQRILELVATNRLPTVTNDSDLLGDGAMLAMAPDEPTIGRNAADYIHRILLGAKPADLPVPSPTLLVSVNLRAAAKIGIAIPDAVIARADRVIR